MKKNDTIKLLAIDDNANNLATLSSVVQDAFPQALVLTATNGRGAIELTATDDPDAILLDIDMTGSLEVCRRLKADDRIEDVPVVFLAALNTDPASRIKALEAGAQGFLTNTLEIAELTAQIKAMAKVKAANRSQRTEIDRLEFRVDECTRELVDEATRRQLLMDQSRDGIVILDQDGLVYESNRKFAEMIGYPHDGMCRLNVIDWEFLHSPEHIMEMIHNVDEKGDHFETKHRRRDGSIYDVEISSNAAFFAGQKLVLCVCRDITERKQAQLALQKKNEELEQFVYSVSHDLKSPLITVRTFLAMLKQNWQSADQQQINEDLNYIGAAADKMHQMLEALLRYSGIGKERVAEQTLSAYQSVEDCLAALAGILHQHEVRVSASKLPQQLHGAPLHFGQIWQNLIENAVKYKGNQSHPQIEIGSTQQAQDVVFYVRDNGMGIASEHSERIFNLFSQLNPDGDGSGLGLSLVKKIVTIYQGRIWVESDGEGRGSCFMFTLPGALIKDDTTT